MCSHQGGKGAEFLLHENKGPTLLDLPFFFPKKSQKFGYLLLSQVLNVGANFENGAKIGP